MAGAMEGRRVLVTGAGTGIGRGIAREFAREGASVALHFAHSGAGAREEVEAIRQAGGRAVALGADFADLDAVRAMAGEALAFLGGLDTLVNNAGITMNRPFDAITPEQFDTLFAVNVRAPYFLTQTVLPVLLKSRGAVVNITSIHAYEGLTEHSAYAGTKGAIVAYTRGLAVELAPKGVRVNAIAPGMVVVENYYKMSPDFDAQAVGEMVPCGFGGEPADIARVAVFLASDAARFIVGQTLVVDGGTTAWMPFSTDYKQADPVQWGRGYVPGL